MILNDTFYLMLFKLKQWINVFELSWLCLRYFTNVLTLKTLLITRASILSPPCVLQGFKLVFQWLSSRHPHGHSNGTVKGLIVQLSF